MIVAITSGQVSPQHRSERRPAVCRPLRESGSAPDRGNFVSPSAQPPCHTKRGLQLCCRADTRPLPERTNLRSLRPCEASSTGSSPRSRLSNRRPDNEPLLKCSSSYHSAPIPPLSQPVPRPTLDHATCYRNK